jgi:hypothetical protein
MEGGLFVFEKQMLSEALCRLFRECLPEDIPNNQLFLYTPHMFCTNIQKAQFISKEHDDYEQVILCKLCSQGDTEHDVHTYFTNPVNGLDIDQTDLKGFMKWLNNRGKQRISSKIS